MPALSMLIKPASSNCNLKCKYCFYHSLSQSRNVSSYGMMDEDTLEIIVKKALDYADGICNFAFQGGEPTLVGLDFYKKLVELQNFYNNKGVKITNSIQTNGILIDNQWIEFLAENKFLVGISLDGPKDIHDLNRIDCKGNGSFKDAMRCIDLFDKYNIQYNILFVVTSNTVRYTKKIYSFFKKNNFKYLQFIPCLDPLMHDRGTEDYSLTSEKFSSFLKQIFNLWYEDFMKSDPISIRYFDNLLGILLGYEPEACDMGGLCTIQNVIEANGGVYPCDFYVTDDLYIGSIKDIGFEELANTEVSENFILSSQKIKFECKDCKWKPLCRGGCRRNWEPLENGMKAENYYCEAYKEFFQYGYKLLYKVAQKIHMERM